jgi:predicted dehydrogenase
LEIETGRIDQMIAIADDSKAQLGAFFPQRYNPVNQVLHHAAQVGRFEKVAVASCLVPWWRDDAYYSKERWQGTMELDGGGAMMNQSIHGVDLVQWVVSAAIKAEAPEEWDVRDNPVDEVFAWTDKLGHDPDLIEVEDTCVANIRYKNGAMGQFLGATSMFPGLLKRTIVGGFGGSVEIQEDELVKYSFAEPQDYDQKVRSYFEKKKTTTGGGAGDPMAIDHGNHQRNIQAFVEAIDEGKPFELDAREARKAVAIIEAIYESARTNQPVVLEPTAIGP